MSGKKNLHEGNILHFSLKVCKKTCTKEVRQYIPLLRCPRRGTVFSVRNAGSKMQHSLADKGGGTTNRSWHPNNLIVNAFTVISKTFETYAGRLLSEITRACKVSCSSLVKILNEQPPCFIKINHLFASCVLL